MMNSQEAMSVPVRIAETIVDEIEEMYDHITRRAYEIFQERGGLSTLDLEDWLTAERELLFKPDVHVEETNRQLTVTVFIGKVSPLDVQLLVTPDAMMVHADGSRARKKVFRVVQFPRRIDVNKVEATYAEGCLVLIA
jgi:HSP20 family molecular chaperone IbpA